MGTRLDEAVAALRRLPPATQDAWARALLDALPTDDTVYALTQDERVADTKQRAPSSMGVDGQKPQRLKT